jgi:hypothetical protein
MGDAAVNKTTKACTDCDLSSFIMVRRLLWKVNVLNAMNPQYSRYLFGKSRFSLFADFKSDSVLPLFIARLADETIRHLVMM